MGFFDLGELPQLEIMKQVFNPVGLDLLENLFEVQVIGSKKGRHRFVEIDGMRLEVLRVVS